MKHILLLTAAVATLASCQLAEYNSVLVSTADELREAILGAEPGAEIIMANGEWNDVRIRFILRHAPLSIDLA